MAKTKGTSRFYFTVGGNLPDGTRVEAGDAVPADLAPAVMRSLKANAMISSDDGIDAEIDEAGEVIN